MYQHLTIRELLTRTIDRLRHTRSRADELAVLRSRFHLALDPTELPPEQVARAARLLDLRRELAEAHGTIESCGTCSQGYPLPEGRWPGGFCCAGSTDGIFSDVEIASLKAAGVDGEELKAPVGDHAGCVFRGPTGCSLQPTQRPNRCVRHLCFKLRRELGNRGDLAHLDRLGDEIESTLSEFARELEGQLEEEAWRVTEEMLSRDFSDG